MGLPWRDCFARVVGVKDTPLVTRFILLMSKCERSADLEGLVMARRNNVLRVRDFRGRLTD
jgi:hypothetical protein